MSDYQKLRELERDVLDSIFKGRDITKILPLPLSHIKQDIRMVC